LQPAIVNFHFRVHGHRLSPLPVAHRAPSAAQAADGPGKIAGGLGQRAGLLIPADLAGIKAAVRVPDPFTRGWP
jgi:hypothetical protein